MLAPIPSAVLHRELARVFELKNTLSDPINPDAYFRNFESSLRENSLKLEAFRKMEAVLSVLAAEAWKTVKQNAGQQSADRTWGRVPRQAEQDA